VPPKVNFDAEWRWIPKSVVTSHVEVLEELSHVEWSHLCVLANDAPASILIIEVYVDGIIIESDDGKMCEMFSKDMQNEFEMFFLVELNLFLGLQICQRDKSIFISYTKYIIEILNKFGMKDYKPISTPMHTNCN
jgi:hypothetical protein